jgi:hypothetical protein
MYFLVVRFRPAASLNELEQTSWERQIALRFHAAQSYNRSMVVDKVRREDALVFMECNSRPGTGSLLTALSDQRAKREIGRLHQPLDVVLVIPFVAAGIARTDFLVDSNGIEQVRSSIAQWLFALMAGDLCGVAL